MQEEGKRTQIAKKMKHIQTIFNDFTTIQYKSLELYDLFLYQFVLKLSQLLHESTVWTDNLPLMPNEVHCCLESSSSFPHEVSDCEAGTPGNPCRAVNKNLPALVLHLLHPSVVVIEILLDRLFSEIINFVQFILVLRVVLERLIE